MLHSPYSTFEGVLLTSILTRQQLTTTPSPCNFKRILAFFTNWSIRVGLLNTASLSPDSTYIVSHFTMSEARRPPNLWSSKAPVLFSFGLFGNDDYDASLRTKVCSIPASPSARPPSAAPKRPTSAGSTRSARLVGRSSSSGCTTITAPPVPTPSKWSTTSLGKMALPQPGSIRDAPVVAHAAGLPSSTHIGVTTPRGNTPVTRPSSVRVKDEEVRARWKDGEVNHKKGVLSTYPPKTRSRPSIQHPLDSQRTFPGAFIDGRSPRHCPASPRTVHQQSAARELPVSPTWCPGHLLMPTYRRPTCSGMPAFNPIPSPPLHLVQNAVRLKEGIVCEGAEEFGTNDIHEEEPPSFGAASRFVVPKVVFAPNPRNIPRSFRNMVK